MEFGKVTLSDTEFNDLDLDIGIGQFLITTKLTGNNKINAGIGNLDINLIDSIENYSIDVDKGIGSININGKNVSDNTKYGNGANHIEVDGGIGSINIKQK